MEPCICLEWISIMANATQLHALPNALLKLFHAWMKVQCRCKWPLSSQFSQKSSAASVLFCGSTLFVHSTPLQYYHEATYWALQWSTVCSCWFFLFDFEMSTRHDHVFHPCFTNEPLEKIATKHPRSSKPCHYSTNQPLPSSSEFCHQKTS